MTGRFRKILACIDVGETSSAALDRAEELAREHGGTVIVLHVVAPNETEPSKAREKLEALVEGRSANGVTWEVRTVGGKPPEAIIEEAGREGVDLIVLSKKGPSSRVREWLLGSTSYQVVRRAPHHVLIVR